MKIALLFVIGAVCCVALAQAHSDHQHHDAKSSEPAQPAAPEPSAKQSEADQPESVEENDMDGAESHYRKWHHKGGKWRG